MDDILTAVSGIKVGHADNQKIGTGCTVILTEKNFTIGAEIMGGAPGSREFALTDSRAAIDQANAIFLSGGSAFGLDAAAGVMKYLKEKNIGFQTGGGTVPIVPAAVIYDLEYKSNKYPDPEMAYQACINAKKNNIKEKAVGAAAGATCGKLLGIENASKTVLGQAAHQVGDLIVSALAIVNAFGDIKDPKSGKILAGTKNNDGTFINTEKTIINEKNINLGFLRENTTLIVVATNASLDKAEANRVAIMSHSGLSRTIYPVHTLLDGDSIFVLAANKVKADINQIGIIAAQVVKKAILNTTIST